MHSACIWASAFSAGLFDYVLNFTHAQRPLLLIPIGIAYFALYYVVFRVCIVRLNLSTPGREADDTLAQAGAPAALGTRGRAFVDALGGAGNLTEVTACTTRLRLSLVNNRPLTNPHWRGWAPVGCCAPPIPGCRWS